MPELPEVETVVRGLRSALPGRAITAVRFGKTDFIDDPAALAARLPGKRVTSVERIGKFICIRLESAPQALPSQTEPQHGALYLLVHLGMTGRLAVRRPGEPAPPHTHVFFDLDNGAELRYTDIRRFGRMLLLSASDLPRFQERLGDDALFVSRETFARKLANCRARIKAFLLDQASLRGMGNIYADESLWLAGIHPARPANRLSAAQASRLHQAIRRVLRAAIKLGGSSISDFLDAEGKPGSYQQRHRVYGREGQKCFRCRAVIQRVIVAGRSSHFCPRCQRPPRARNGAPPMRANSSSHRRAAS